MSYELLNDDYSDFRGYASRPTIPPNGLLESGGGVANFAHGMPGGPYRRSSERSDIYGYSTPRTDKIYGNMYTDGPSYMENFDLWTDKRKQQTENYAYAWNQHAPKNFDAGPHSDVYYDNSGMHRFSPYPGEAPAYGEPEQKKNSIEHFEHSSDDKATTPIEELDSSYETIDKCKSTSLSPYLALLLFIILFIAIDYWIRGSNMLLEKYLLKGRSIEPWHLFAIAVVITFIFIGLAYYLQVSVKLFEDL